ncbi:hypothetical protein BCR33DRAFT_721502 [Rhizoclosmatium globosum]|uniref:Cation efflux protein n=1 Tax=Rhizoclosmatium globosum TaxID=329046 RepID=A0A1Y2BTK0_9FUNG|nr:hypothetical protein BCR33DRAFT_721908 [Rhizoclosmatium globosum]ORY37455.1 hypothetical protein BCR33DRAFT_721502 [Rhizoclosmatium globosum]|eukprot:ORY36692.1 hypothetical protein BCR33DRAFT_721908 [Rhizoclosmatium globosum]
MADAFMDLASSVVLVFATVSAADKNPQHYPAGKQRFETAAIVVFSCIMGSLMTHDVDIQLVDTVRAYSSGAGYFVEVDIVMDPNTFS